MINQSTSAFSSFGSSTDNVVRLTNQHRILLSEKTSPWGNEITERLQELVRLQRGWDGYQAQPVSFINASFALQMLNNICGIDTSLPQIVPGVSGDLQIEWHTAQGDLELHVKAPNDVHAWRYFVGGDDAGEEQCLTNDFADVAQWVREIAEPQIATAAAA